MRVLVTGGRDYDNQIGLFDVLDTLHRQKPITTIIHGACRVIIKDGRRTGVMTGADRIADDWARANGIPVEDYPVDHALDGPWPAAGPRRNARMLKGSDPDIVVATPGDRGTKNMKDLARAADVRLLITS